MNKQIKPHYTYADAEEKYVKNIMLYGMIRDEESVFELYYDEKFEHAVDGKDLLNLFLKGLTIACTITVAEDSDPMTLYSTPNMYTTFEDKAALSVFLAGRQSYAYAPNITE